MKKDNASETDSASVFGQKREKAPAHFGPLSRNVLNVWA
jgi:hypothetical protein